MTESSRQQHDLRVEIADNANNPTSLVYPTQYFAAENADDLNTAFQQIAHLITASAKVPTEVTGSPEASGYITYSDPIGEYMEVKDVKSLILAGQEFTVHTVQGDGADTKTYVFAGEVDSPVYGQHSLSEITITVTTDSNGNQTLEVKIPCVGHPHPHDGGDPQRRRLDQHLGGERRLPAAHPLYRWNQGTACSTPTAT